MLIVTEVAEMTEEIREGNPDVYVEQDGVKIPIELPEIPSFILTENGNTPEEKMTFRKPEGEAIELADVLIRCLDYAGSKGWDVDALVRTKLEYNKTRSFRHGGKLL
jgi:hypothetical protein